MARKNAPGAPKLADLKQKVAQYFDLESPTERLAILEELAALDPALRDRLRYPRGSTPFVVPESQIPSARLDVALSLFAKEDRVYWTQHDPAAFPFVPNTTRGVAWDPALRATEAATTGWQATGDGARPDYAAARTMLEAMLENEHLQRDASMVLAVIALREERPEDVFACLGAKQGDTLTEWSLYFGAAYFALGDTERAAACYTYGVNLGFVAEQRGDFATADRLYRKGLEDGWYVMRPYAKLRLARLEQRLGARELERLRAAEVGDKIVVNDLANFHTQFPAIADALRAKLGITRERQPLSDAEIAKIRIARKRHGVEESVELPESAKTILRYDRNFALDVGVMPLFEPLLYARKEPVPSVDVEKLVRTALKHDDTGLRALAKLPKSVPVWNDAAELPACIRLASPGDQALFLYTGVPDAHGEYPIARFDDQPEVWISAASLLHYVLEEVKTVVNCTIDFAPLLKAAKTRNAKHQETFSAHPQVTAARTRT